MRHVGVATYLYTYLSLTSWGILVEAGSSLQRGHFSTTRIFGSHWKPPWIFHQQHGISRNFRCFFSVGKMTADPKFCKLRKCSGASLGELIATCSKVAARLQPNRFSKGPRSGQLGWIDSERIIPQDRSATCYALWSFWVACYHRMHRRMWKPWFAPGPIPNQNSKAAP